MGRRCYMSSPFYWRVEMPTPVEKEEYVKLVRILVGDTNSCMFYPMVDDDDILTLLELEKWNILRGAKRVAITIAFMLSSYPTRERSYDVEVWNEFAKSYKNVLDTFINDAHSLNIPNDVIPYAAGISKEDVSKYRGHPDTNRSPLSQITPCNEWWTKLENSSWPTRSGGTF